MTAQLVEAAKKACHDGHPGEALLLGHELHWYSHTGVEEPAAIIRSEQAKELLALAYRALGRDALAEIAEVHHQHRLIPSVGVYER